jgi:D-3-phosphoglycerate dehydrogenase
MDQFIDRFVEAEISVSQPEVMQQLSEDELCEVIGDFDGMIAGDDQLTARALEQAGRMKIISKWGVGTDGIDKEAAARLGIAVTNTPSVFGDEVADVAIGYVIMLARQLHRIDRAVREGEWLKIEGQTLADHTMGIVGFGSIGRSIARRAAAFGMRVCSHDVTPQAQALAREAGVRTAGLAETLAEADYLVLSCPLTAETRGIINADTLASMKPGARLVNVSRGPLVEEAALTEALAGGRLAGAALDVFEVEPLPMTSPLRDFDACILGSHNGSNTTEAILRASAKAVDNLLAGLRRDR